MTDTSHRIYAVAVALAVFLVSWAAVAARPWATTEPDPRLAALARREQHLRADAELVRQVVDRRMAAYRVALRARQARIAQTRSHALGAAQATTPPPTVRIVTLPPLTVTRSS
jgi:hypothetical protein